MRNYSDLRPEQLAGIEHIVEGTMSILLADVGTGKTVMVLTALQEMFEKGYATRALVVAPRRVVTDVWSFELHEWTHLKPSLLRIWRLTGLTAEERVYLIAGGANVLLINYELLPWLMETYPEGLPGFDTIVFDEVDKLKSPTSLRFKGTGRKRDPVTRKQIPGKPGMKQWSQLFTNRIGMTGTPVPNHLLDLWAQVCVIDGGERLGDDYYRFKRMHFYQDDYAGFKFEILPGREQYIHEQIADLVFRIEARPGNGTPHVVELPPRWVELDSALRVSYRKMERDYIALMTPLDKTEAPQVVTSETAGAVYGKLRQMAQGFAYVGDEDRTAVLLGMQKLAELDDLISELQGQPVLLVYHFVHQLTQLQKRYPGRLKHLGGGQSDAEASETIAAWNANQIPILAVQPQSAGHGLNLQHGGAHHVVMLTLPESAGAVTQVVGRLARSGNPSGTVYVHRILTRDTVDEERDAVVRGKITTDRALLDAMKARQK